MPFHDSLFLKIPISRFPLALIEKLQFICYYSSKIVIPWIGLMFLILSSLISKFAPFFTTDSQLTRWDPPYDNTVFPENGWITKISILKWVTITSFVRVNSSRNILNSNLCFHCDSELFHACSWNRHLYFHTSSILRNNNIEYFFLWYKTSTKIFTMPCKIRCCSENYNGPRSTGFWLLSVSVTHIKSY